jgi:lipid A 3-O-deacylase
MIDHRGKGRTLTGTKRFFFIVLTAGMFTLGVSAAAAQATSGSANDAGIKSTLNGPGISNLPTNPVDQVRQAKSWEYGPFVNWGTGIGDRSDFKFFWAGLQAGKPLTPVLHAGILSGQFEYGVNIVPFWQAYTPAAHEGSFSYPGGYYLGPEGGGAYTGVNLTPVILRWNFLTSSRRFQPWFQGAGGLIYTTHKFPPDLLVPHGTPGGTSVFNFTPQGGIGMHYFTRPKRSIDVGVNAVHISSASLGDRNPGVNASIQVQVGYTFWK